MTRLVTCLAVVVLSFGSEPDNPALEADLGTWRVGRLLFLNPYAIGQGLTRAQARARLGSTLVITKRGIARLGPQPCDEGRVVETLDRDELLRSYKLTTPPGEHLNLGLPSKVAVFSYGCIELWLRADGHMVAPSDAYYFELTRDTKRRHAESRK